MNSTRITLPLAAAALFALTGALELAHDQMSPFTSTLDYLIEGAFVAALAAGAAALWQLRDRGGRTRLDRSPPSATERSCSPPAPHSSAARNRSTLSSPSASWPSRSACLVAAIQDARGRLAPRGAGFVLLAGWAITVASNSALAIAAGWALVALLEQRWRGHERLDRASPRAREPRARARRTPPRAPAG